MAIVSSINRQTGWAAWLTWAAATAVGVSVCMLIAIPAGYGLGEAVEPSLGRAAAYTLAGLVFGLALGAGLSIPQAVLLGSRGGAAWVVASCLGGMAAGALGFGLVSPSLGSDSRLGMVFVALCMALGIGLAQGLVLRQGAAYAGRWALAATAGIAAALVIGFALGGEGREVLAVTVVGLLAGGLTGAARVWLLRSERA